MGLNNFLIINKLRVFDAISNLTLTFVIDSHNRKDITSVNCLMLWNSPFWARWNEICTKTTAFLFEDFFIYRHYKISIRGSQFISLNVYRISRVQQTTKISKLFLIVLAVYFYLPVNSQNFVAVFYVDPPLPQNVWRHLKFLDFSECLCFYAF